MEGCGHWKFAAGLSPEELWKTLHRTCIDCADQNIVKLVEGPNSRRNSLHSSGRWRSRVVGKATATAAWSATRIARRSRCGEPHTRDAYASIRDWERRDRKCQACRAEEQVGRERQSVRDRKKTCKRGGKAKTRNEYVCRDWRQSDRKCKTCRVEEQAVRERQSVRDRKNCSSCGASQSSR